MPMDKERGWSSPSAFRWGVVSPPGASVHSTAQTARLLWGQTLGLNPSKGCEGPCDRSGTTPACVASAAVVPEAVPGDTPVLRAICWDAGPGWCPSAVLTWTILTLDHPYLGLHTPATATWVIEKCTEELHLVWIIREKSSSFTANA